MQLMICKLTGVDVLSLLITRKLNIDEVDLELLLGLDTNQQG